MADRGYDSTKYMQAVDAAGGSFLIRVRKSHDPIVLKIYRRGTRYRKLEGQRLSRVLRRCPKDKHFDMDVSWDENDDSAFCLRLVTQWNGAEKGWHRLLNNLSRSAFPCDDILKAYRLRWQIELLFKELKSYANLHKFSTCKEPIAEGLIWASLCAAFLKRYLAHACQRVTRGVAISTRRVAMCGHHLLAAICFSLLRGVRGLKDALCDVFRFLSHNARRSNQERERKTGRLQLGLQLCGKRASTTIA